MNKYVFRNYRTEERIEINAESLFESKHNNLSAHEQLKDKLAKESRFYDLKYYRVIRNH